AGRGESLVKLAVIAGDGIGPEVVGQAVKVLDAVLPGVEKTSYDLGARRYPIRCSTNYAAMTRSCSAPSVTRRCPAVCWNVGCCLPSGSRSTTTSTCDRHGCIRA